MNNDSKIREFIASIDFVNHTRKITFAEYCNIRAVDATVSILVDLLKEISKLLSCLLLELKVLLEINTEFL